MWAVDETPFDLKVGTFQSIPALGCSPDYIYKLEREDLRMAGLKFIDPDAVHFVEPINPNRMHPPERLRNEHVPLGGRAWRTLWQRRTEIPESWWEICYHQELGFSQFYFDGMEIFNPHLYYCWAYLRRFKGQIYWGFTPTEYSWNGYAIPAIAMKPSRALWGKK
jgi:hypothetical protein